MISRLSPLTLLLYFLFAGLLPSFSRQPLMQLLSLLFGLLMLLLWEEPRRLLKGFPGSLVFFLIITLINPLFYHDGATVLFYINGRRFTLEALAYGADTAAMLLSLLIWSFSLTHYLTSEKVLALFGSFSPKIAVVISLILRFIPEYLEEIKSYRAIQRVRGLYGEGSFLERLRAEGLIFSGFLSRSLEHSMTTADSMTARGYGTGKRRAFKPYRARACDYALSIFALFLGSILCLFTGLGVFSLDYYSAEGLLRAFTGSLSPQAFLGLGLYAALCLSLPFYAALNHILNAGRRIK